MKAESSAFILFKMNLKNILVFSASISLLASCSKTSPTGTGTDTTATKQPTDTIAIANWGLPQTDTNIFHTGTQMGRYSSGALSAVSGMAASRAYPGMFWLENDQGDPNAAIYLVDSTGAVHADYAVTGATNRDWTDMTIGPGPGTDTTYLYVADIGDSPGDHPYSIVYRFQEPNMPLGTTELYANTAHADQIKYKYPDGPRDAETILIDPQSKDLYIVDKNINGNLYELPYPQSTDTIITATKLLENLHFGPWRCGAIGANRRDLILKGYNAMMYWPITPGESILDVLLSEPVYLSLSGINEPQGEAMCLAVNDSAIWTTSKFDNFTYANLDRFLRK